MLASSFTNLILALSCSFALGSPVRVLDSTTNSTTVAVDNPGPVARSNSTRQAADGVITNCVHQGEYAVTFDDGPYTYGHDIAKLIEQHGGKATFFVNGYNWDCIYNYADELIARYKAGHQIASHTWNHADITLLTPAKLEERITLVETALGKILGVKPRYFRPPYGAVNSASVKQVQDMGYQVVTWDSDSEDANGASPSASIDTYQQLVSTYPAPHMTLNHETHSTTSEQVMPAIVPQLVNAGYKLVTVAQCLGQKPYQSTFKAGKRDSSWTCDGTPGPNEN